MAATTAAVAIAAGATVAASQSQKSAAKKAGAAYEGVGQNLGDVSNVEQGIKTLMGSTDENKRYESMRDAAFNIISQQQKGEISQSTQQMLARRAVESGAVGLGPAAVGDNFTAYLGLTSEQLKQQGLDNYRNYLAQLTETANSQINSNYARQFNAAQAKAGTAMQVGAANAGMWNGIASIAGGFAGGGFGGAGAAGGSAASQYAAGASNARAGMSAVGGI